MPQPYKVISLDKVLEQFKQLHQQAKLHGTVPKLLEAANKITSLLAVDPALLGEPLFRLKSLNLVVCVAIVPPLVVDFGFDEERRIAIIQRFRPYPEINLGNRNGDS